MSSSKAMEVVNGICKVSLKDSASYLLVVNQALLDDDPDQSEALFQPHQLRAHGTIVDDTARRHLGPYGPGLQMFRVDDVTVPLHYDGWKTFLSIAKPTEEDLNNLRRLELTSPLKYEPQERLVTRRANVIVDHSSLLDWRARLGFPTLEVTKRTLQNTTQLVRTLEAETREYMRDHFQARLRMLRPYRINDTLFTDTFFASVKSVRGYDKFQMFAFYHCKVDIGKLMHRESQAVGELQDIIREIGAPNYIVSDNAKVYRSSAWIKVLRDNVIESRFSEAYHQNQNYAELRGGLLKTAVLKLFHMTPWAPLEYWCYAVEYLNYVRPLLAQQSLDWRPGQEVLQGETPDISVLRFRWFAPVWYYNPRVSFPCDKMSPGFMLGIAPTVGDGFSYTILPVKEYSDIPLTPHPTTVIRSVVRLRDMSSLSEEAPTCRESLDGFQFFDKNNNQLVGDLILEEIDDCTSSPVEPLLDDVSSLAPSGMPSLDPSTDPTLGQLDAVSSPVNSSEEVEPIPSAVALPQQVVPTTTEDLPSGADDDDAAVPHVTQSQEDDSSVASGESVATHSDDEPVIPSTDDGDIDGDVLAQQVNNFFNSDNPAEEFDSDFSIVRIVSHRCVDGILELEVEYSSGDKEFHPIALLKEEDPHAVAEYVLRTDLGRHLNTIHRRWARSFLRVVRRAMRRLFRVNHGSIPCPPSVDMGHISSSRGIKRQRLLTIRRQKKKKPGRNNRQQGTFKYGLEVPRTWKDVLRIDKAAGNKKWQEAVMKEIAALIHHQCFEFKSAKFKPSADYQYAPLRLVYDIKSDLRYKARLVVQGHRVDPRGLSTRATVVKGISVRLLDVIAHHQGLRVLTGDVGNAFIQAFTKEKCYTRLGAEFGDRAGMIAIIVRALYGLTTSAERYRTLFADFLRGLGFTPTRYDRDVWMRLRESADGYDYICTHVDDFKIVAKDPERWMEMVKGTFLVKESGERDYYLGNNYVYHKAQDLWTMGTTTFAHESIRRVESVHGVLRKYKTPLPPADSEGGHPETDTSPLLDTTGLRQYQHLLGMLQWLVTIGRPDLCNAVASLSRFSACPREFHLELALRCFGYLKMFPNRLIAIDSRPLVFDRCSSLYEKLRPDFLQDYPDAVEEMDPHFPKAFGKTLETTILVDSDHAHDLVTRRSLTGLIAFVGSTPVEWFSKRQGAVASSTYQAEFSALRTAVEEAQSLRYMLRCLGIPIPFDGSAPTRLFGDNFSVIQNANDPDATLKKKHVAISFHVVREAIAAGVVAPYWLKGKHNVSDIMTKQITSQAFLGHVASIFWEPDFHIRTKNNLSEGA
jgi:hypothetical protein